MRTERERENEKEFAALDTVLIGLRLLFDEGIDIDKRQRVTHEPLYRRRLAKATEHLNKSPTTDLRIAQAILTTPKGESRIWGPEEWFSLLDVKLSDNEWADACTVPFSEQELRERAKSHFLCYLLDTVHDIPWTPEHVLQRHPTLNIEMSPDIEPLLAAKKEISWRPHVPRRGWHLLKKNFELVRFDREWRERKFLLDFSSHVTPLIERLQAFYLYSKLVRNETPWYRWFSYAPGIVKLSQAEDCFRLNNEYPDMVPTISGNIESGKITISYTHANFSSTDKLEKALPVNDGQPSFCHIHTSFEPR